MLLSFTILEYTEHFSFHNTYASRILWQCNNRDFIGGTYLVLIISEWSFEYFWPLVDDTAYNFNLLLFIISILPFWPTVKIININAGQWCIMKQSYRYHIGNLKQWLMSGIMMLIAVAQIMASGHLRCI